MSRYTFGEGRLAFRGEWVDGWDFWFDCAGQACYSEASWASGPREGLELDEDELAALDAAYPEELAAASRARADALAEDQATLKREECT